MTEDQIEAAARKLCGVRFDGSMHERAYLHKRAAEQAKSKWDEAVTLATSSPTT